MGKSVVDFVAPEDREMILKYAEERRLGRNPPPMYEVKLLRPDGTTVETESHVSLITYNGKPSSLVVSRDISGRKKMEAELKAGEERYKNFLDRQLDAVFVLNSEKYLYANQVAAEMLGYSSPSEIVGLPSYSVVSPRDRDKVREMTEVRAQGKPVPNKYEIRLLRRDGSEIETEVNATLINYEGKPVSLGVHRDVTESNRVAAELKASEERYKSLIDASLDAVFVIRDEKYIYTNKEAARMLGYDEPSQILDRDIIEFFHPDEKERIRRYLRERRGGGSPPSHYSTRLIKKDGSEVIVDTKVAPIDYNGKPATLAIGRDVTARHIMEKTLRRSEAEKTALLSTIPDSLSLIDREYRYLWVNEAEAASCGKKPEDIIGKPCYTLSGESSRPCDRCPIETVFKLGKNETWTTTTPEGRLWENRASPIMDNLGEVSSILVLARDVTDLNRSQWRTNALHTSALKIESINTEEGVWEAVHNALTEVLGYKNAAVGIVEGDELVFKPKFRVFKVHTALPLNGAGITLRAIKSLKPQLVRDTREDGEYVPGGSPMGRDTYKAELAVPVVVDGKGIAVLNTESVAVDSYSEDDQRLIEILALYAAQAIKRIRQMNLLSKSEEDFRRLAENAADVLFVVALDGTITYTSKDVNPHVGYTREEFVGQNIMKFLPPSEMSRLMEIFGEASIEGPNWGPLMLNIEKKGGGTAVLEFNPSPMVTDGKITAIQVVVRDISTRIDLQKKLNALHVSAHRLSEAASSGEVWEIAVETLRSVLGFRRADIGVVSGESVTFSHGLNKDHPTFTLPLTGNGVTVRAIKSMQTQHVRDVSKDPSYIPGIEMRGVDASELVVPVVVDGVVAAVINLEENKINAFAEDDIHLAETLALHINSAISRIWHAEAEQLERVRLAALHKSSVRLSAATTIEDVWRLVFEDLYGVMGYQLAGVGLIEDEFVRFRRGTSLMPVDSFELPLNGRGITIRAIKTKETQLVKNIRDDPDHVVVPGINIEAYTSELAVPVIVNGEVAALINVEQKGPRVLNEGDARLVETLALHASTAVARLMKMEEETRYRQRLEVLNKHASDLEDVETLEEALKLTYDALVALGLTSPSISLLQGDSLVVPPIEGRDSVKPMSLPLDGPGITVRAVKTRKTQLVNDTTTDPDLVPSPNGTNIGSELVAPLRIGEEVVGVLNLENAKKNAYTEEDARIVEMLASHVSSALNRLRILDGLHKEVEDRTNELLVAEQMAAVGRISAMVAHDLRVPLQTISNASRLIQQRPEKTPEMITYINSAVDRSVRMLEDLRLNTREEPLRLTPTNLHALITQTIKEMQAAKGVEYDIRIDDGVGSVPLDPLKMRRVFDNLFRNAVEAMPEGGWITISARRVVDWLIIEVSDTGKGIPPEVKEKLFRPFSSTKISGLGLGLTYCKKAVEAHGGTITVENVEGSGARFTIRVPVGTAQ
jgi:PAS domain S-box-containing protein